MDGEKLTSFEALVFLIGRRISLPDVSALEPEVVASAIARRLTVMAKANRFVDVELNNVAKTPNPIINYLQDLANNTPLRLTARAEAIGARKAIEAPAPSAQPPQEKQAVPSASTHKKFSRNWIIILVAAMGYAGTLVTTMWKAEVNAPMASRPQPVTQPAAWKPEVTTAVIQELEPQKATVDRSSRYTIQIASYVLEESRARFFDKNRQLSNKLRTVESKTTGETRYLVTYGSYVDYEAANKAKQSMPAELRVAHPFIIDLDKR